MTDSKDKSRDGRRRRNRMHAPLPRLALWIALGFACGNAAWAQGETFLPTHEITLSGKVTAPSCQAQLNAQTINFKLQRSEVSPKRGPDVSEKVDGSRQQLILQLSECEFDGVGLTFKADALPGYPERGMLTGMKSNTASTATYYTIGPAKADYAGKPLFKVAADSAEWVKDNAGDLYFQLNQSQYWLEVKASLQGADVMNIPFNIDIHQLSGSSNKDLDETLGGRFTLQLAYR